MERYKHRVNYYETDSMGIVHHSNYIRFMEEARVDYLDQIGFNYKKLEDSGMASPVLGYSVETKHSAKFDDIIEIEVTLASYSGVKLEFNYKMFVGEKEIATGKTKHCFINKEGFPIIIHKTNPEIDNKFKELLNQ